MSRYFKHMTRLLCSKLNKNLCHVKKKHDCHVNSFTVHRTKSLTLLVNFVSGTLSWFAMRHLSYFSTARKTGDDLIGVARSPYKRRPRLCRIREKRNIYYEVSQNLDGKTLIFKLSANKYHEFEW